MTAHQIIRYVAKTTRSDPLAGFVFDAGTNITTSGRQPLAASFNAREQFDAGARAKEGRKQSRKEKTKEPREDGKPLQCGSCDDTLD